MSMCAPTRAGVCVGALRYAFDSDLILIGKPPLACVPTVCAACVEYAIELTGDERADESKALQSSVLMIELNYADDGCLQFFPRHSVELESISFVHLPDVHRLLLDAGAMRTTVSRCARQFICPIYGRLYRDWSALHFVPADVVIICVKIQQQSFPFVPLHGVPNMSNHLNQANVAIDFQTFGMQHANYLALRATRDIVAGSELLLHPMQMRSRDALPQEMQADSSPSSKLASLQSQYSDDAPSQTTLSVMAAIASTPESQSYEDEAKTLLSLTLFRHSRQTVCHRARFYEVHAMC